MKDKKSMNKIMVDDGMVRDEKSLKKAIINIGQTIIDMANDNCFVTSKAVKIKITAEITPDDFPKIEWLAEAFVLPKRFYRTEEG